MKPREGAGRRSGVLATVVGLALALTAFGVWAFGASPSASPSPTSANQSAAAGTSAVAGAGPAATAAPGGQRPPGSSAGSSSVDPRDLDALAASEDAAARQTSGQRPATKGASFVGEVGTYLVGRGIPPGTYESAGGFEGRTCHWFRLKGLTDKPADVVASGTTTGPTRVTIVAADAFFQTRDCATWHRVTG